jgi:hypothetical protein
MASWDCGCMLLVRKGPVLAVGCMHTLHNLILHAVHNVRCTTACKQSYM